MAKISLSRVEVIPFLDKDGQIIQMRNFELSVTATQEEGETTEQVEKLLDETFEKQRQIVSEKTPLLKLQTKKINYILQEFKKLVNLQDFNKIVDMAKTIK